MKRQDMTIQEHQMLEQLDAIDIEIQQLRLIITDPNGTGRWSRIQNAARHIDALSGQIRTGCVIRSTA